jgi:hypothetical protein
MEVVGLTLVWMAYLRLKPIFSPIKKWNQGSKDPDSPWAKARLKYVTQILVRFCVLLATDLKDADGTVPDKVNALKLTKVSINQIAFWDETHLTSCFRCFSCQNVMRDRKSVRNWSRNSFYFFLEHFSKKGVRSGANAQ